MDTSDYNITFDNEGVCNYCHEFDQLAKQKWHRGETGKKLLEQKIAEIKNKNKNNQFDCILGLSGGVDSSYLALKAKEWGLRPVVVHIDTGWDSDISTKNVKKIVEECDYQLITYVIDWREMRDLQLSYLKASVANQDVPQDHAIFASLYHFAVKNKITTILSGGNIATEGISPHYGGSDAMDAINLLAIYKKYGNGKLKQYKTMSFFQYYIWYPFFKKMKTFRPLNYISYNKQEAISYLKATVGWQEYDRKHGESIFTKFYQNYYLPKKFGYDKRRAHYSSLILSGQMTREDALRLLEEPLYNEEELEEDIQYICSKLEIGENEFKELMNAPIRSYKEFPNWDQKKAIIKKLQKYYGLLFGKNINIYS